SAAASLVAGTNAPIAAMSARIIALTRTIARSIVYAKMKVALTVVLLILSVAVTTGSVVAKYVDLKNIHLPSINPVNWIRPLLRSLAPSPQVNATKSDNVADRPEDALASSEQSKPIRLHVDLGWDRVDPTPAPSFVTPVTVAKTQATAKTVR